MAFYIGEMKKVRNSFFEAYKDGDYKKAIVLGNKLLQIYAENDDCDCIEYAVDMSNLAMVFDRLQLYPQAEKYYKQAAELKKRCGGESLSYADTLNNLAIVYNQTNRQTEALRLHRKVLEIRDGLTCVFEKDGQMLSAGSMRIFCTACTISGIHTSFWGNMTRRSNTMRWH